MEITFADAKLKILCEQGQSAKRKHGDPSARKLMTRIADLNAAASVYELVAGNPHPLVGKRLGQFALDLHGGMRLVFEPANEPLPKNLNGSVDWCNVSRVRIIYIGNYHD